MLYHILLLLLFELVSPLSLFLSFSLFSSFLTLLSGSICRYKALLHFLFWHTTIIYCKVWCKESLSLLRKPHNISSFQPGTQGYCDGYHVSSTAWDHNRLSELFSSRIFTNSNHPFSISTSSSHYRALLAKMPFKSRWQIDIPNTHLASALLTSPTHPLSKTHRCFSEAARPDTHYFTPHDFRLWCQRFAAGLRKHGLQAGDRLLLYSGNDLFFPVVFLGTIMAGGIFTGANPSYVARELAYQLQDSGASYLICAEGSLDTGIEAARLAGLNRDRVFVFNKAIYDGQGHAVNGCRYWGDLIASEDEGSGFAWDDLSSPELADRTLALNYSSGTTGRPKGVEITHKNYVANLRQFNHLSYLNPDWKDKQSRLRWLCFLPMYHAMAQNIFIASALSRDIPVYIMPKFDFLKVLEYTEKFRISDLIVVPPVAVALAKHPAVKSGKYDLSSVESISSGAAPLGREVCVEVEALWEPGRINLKQGWGMTE